MSEGSTIEDVAPEDAKRLQDSGAVLLDVRESDEWNAGHAPNAEHLPLAEVEGSVARFQGQSVLAVCRMGSGLPVVSEDGSPGTIS